MISSWPWVTQSIFTLPAAVLTRVLAEDVGQEGAECRVPLILDLEADDTDGKGAQHHQVLKE